MDFGKTILEKTNDLTEGLVSAMTSVIDFLECTYSDDLSLGCKYETDFIERYFPDTFRNLGECLNYIRFNWSDIIHSEMLEYDLLVFIQHCRVFHYTVSDFDDCICRNYDSAIGILQDCWIGRSYLVEMESWKNRASFAINYARKNFLCDGPLLGEFEGMAKRFRNYFVNVTDEQLMGFVMSNQPIPSRPKWIGGRVEATLMGLELGISCADMNRSFLFLDAAGRPRKLKYSSNPVSMSRQYYGIHSALDSLKAAIKTTKNSQ